MPSPAFHRIAAEGRGRKGYSGRLHRRVDDLVAEWAGGARGIPIACTSDPGIFREEVDEAQDWVLRNYEARWGRGPVGGLPLIGVLFWPVVCGIISWIVQRTLEELFPRAAGQQLSTGSGS